MNIGDKILVARPGYYPLLMRAYIRSLTREAFAYVDASTGYRLFRDEGITWCRGHDLHSPEADALRVAAALSRP